MNTSVVLLAFAVLLGGWAPVFGQAPTSAQNNLAPFVPSPQHIVERMLELGNLKAGETVYDLGCGDGRILVTAVDKFRAKAVGVEISPELVRQANENIKRHNAVEQAKVIQGDLLEVDLSDADVVTLYLLTHSNERLRPRLEKLLKPGARIVSHDFAVRGWKPIAVEKIAAHNRMHTIYVYQIEKK